MNSKLSYILNILIAISFIVCAITAYSGPIDLHEVSGGWFIALTIIHIILHWKWFLIMTKNIFKK